MNLSYWEHTTFFKDLDIAIIGGGIVGLNAALHLKTSEPKLKIAIFERGALPNGASTKNAGFACFGSVSELLMDLEEYSENEVFSLVEKRWKGLQKLRKRVGDTNLQYQNWGGYELFQEDESYEKCANKIPFLNSILKEIIGENVYQEADNQIDDFGFKKVKHLIFNQYEGQIHTGMMMKALTEKVRSLGVDIFNGLVIRQIQENGKGVALVLEDDTILFSKKIIVTTNAFAKELLPALEVTPGRGQVIVTSPIKNLPIKGTFHLDKGYTYFRNIEDRILIGGGRNLDFKTEETTEFGLTTIIQNHLEKLLHQVILPTKDFQIDYRWSGIMGFGKVQAPIVKRVSESILCAVKLQGMGVAIGSLIGEEVAELYLNC